MPTALGRRWRLRNKILLSLALTLFFPASLFAKLDARANAIQAVKGVFKDCPQCLLFAVPAESTLFRHHDLFFVSTLDRIPPPYWTVAVSKSGKTFILDSKNVSDWNSLSKEEEIQLTTDEECFRFSKEFLTLASGRGIFIDKLTTYESSQIQKVMKSLPSFTGKIVRNKDRIGLMFYAKDVSGALQQWNLIVTPKGQIIKVDVREF